MGYPQCAKCSGTYCRLMPMEKIKIIALPEYCPMKIKREVVEDIVKRYVADEVRKIYVPATMIEKEAYQEIRGVKIAIRPRIKEVIEFGKLIGAKKIGLAFCAGLRDEAKRVSEYFEIQGFEVPSVMCKCGGVDKTALYVPAESKIEDPSKFEAACNPIIQAELLNEAETDFNVIVGLCVGHDMLFTKYSRAPVTTLIVKDRMLAHNPVMALYSSYHRSIIER